MKAKVIGVHHAKDGVWYTLLTEDGTESDYEWADVYEKWNNNPRIPTEELTFEELTFDEALENQEHEKTIGLTIDIDIEV